MQTESLLVVFWRKSRDLIWCLTLSGLPLWFNDDRYHVFASSFWLDDEDQKSVEPDLPSLFCILKCLEALESFLRRWLSYLEHFFVPDRVQ